MADTTNRPERSFPVPQHPLPPGGYMPSLNLAGADGLNVASGSSIQSMPDPGKPVPYTPVLHGSPDLGGIDPQMPIPVLNLAGIEGVPLPSQLVRPAPNQINMPDFGEPDFSQPELQAYDLTEPGITFASGSEYAPDPMLPDITEYHYPYGLDIRNQTQADLSIPDPLVGGRLDYEQPNGITVSYDLQESDPLLPDLRQPLLSHQDVHMADRPGDLDPSALEQMHLNPAYHTNSRSERQISNEVQQGETAQMEFVPRNANRYQSFGTVPYNEIFMDQSGMNSTRRRHYDLLMRGLDSVE